MKLHILSIQNESGEIVKILSNTDYDTLLLDGMEAAKKLNGYWTIFDRNGRMIDGNFKPGLNELLHKAKEK